MQKRETIEERCMSSLGDFLYSIIKIVVLLLAGYGLGTLIFASCTPPDPWQEMDKYCYSWCQVHYKDDVKYAEWMGNDHLMNISHCICYLGEEGFGVGRMVPIKEYEAPQ
jgi:hypothetical protein